MGFPAFELDARFHHAVELVGHLRVAALHGVEIEVGVCLVLAASLGRGGAAAHADPVRGTADLHHEHPDVALLLLEIRVINLPEPAGEHDGLDPLATLAVLQSLTEAAAVPRDERLAELVAVVGGAVGRVHEDLKRFGEVRRVLELRRPLQRLHGVRGCEGYPRSTPRCPR